MGNIISKMGLYDLFARGVTGLIVLCAADLFGISNVLGSDIPVWAIVLGGYFCGLVLEELSYLSEKLFHSRERLEQEVCSKEKYREYDYEKCKRALSADDQEIIRDEPLAHVIMSSSLQIAFFAFLLLDIADAICCCEIVSRNFISPSLDIVILDAMILIFHGRANHYIKRRTEKIFDLCIAKEYKNIKKD